MMTKQQFEDFIAWLEKQRDEAPLLSERQRTINDVLGHLGRNGLVVILRNDLGNIEKEETDG